MARANKDLRSPLARARDKWLASEKGKKCCEGNTQGQYLRNRLELAFIAGWNARNNLKAENG